MPKVNTTNARSRSAARWRNVTASAVFATLVSAPLLQAQITAAEYGARRDSLAARIGSGVVVACGERTPVSDFGPFYQLPAFRYLTGYEYADAALLMVVRSGRATSTLFVTRSEPRRSLYYGAEPDSTEILRETGLASRPADALASMVEPLAAAALPIFTLRDFEDADFAAAVSLTRGGQFIKALASRHPGLVVRDAHPLVAELRARKSAAELALLRRAAEISVEGHRALMQGAQPGMYEYQLAAIIGNRSSGAPCVAGGSDERPSL